jgi:fatty acid desaturase
VVTARNIRGGRFTDFMLGGLNYQIEHHLFPTMPRPNLQRVQGLVRDFCAAADLGYREESLVESFRQIVHHLSDVGAASRVQAPLAPGGAARSPAAGSGNRRADGRYPGARQTASTLLPSGHARRRLNSPGDTRATRVVHGALRHRR